MSWFVFRRLFVFFAVLGFGYALTQLVTPVSDLIGISDGLLFLLSSVVFVNAWKPTVLFFTEQPLRFSRLLSLAVSFWMAAFMCAAVWAIRWRASDYSETFSDDALRFGFRYLAICGTLCAATAPEFFEQDISSKRIGKLAVGLACIFITVLVLVYGARLQHRLEHDQAPTLSNERPDG